MARAKRRRSTVTKESPAFSAAFSAVSRTRASGCVMTSCPFPPLTVGTAERAASTPTCVSFNRPPARSISEPARPSLSSVRTFRICSGRNCWWPLARAIVCADWMKPFTLSEYFSIFIFITPLISRARIAAPGKCCGSAPDNPASLQARYRKPKAPVKGSELSRGNHSDG